MENLPTEIAQGIAKQAFLPNSENDHSPYPVDDGPPNLALMNANHHFRAIFEQYILPESVVIEMRQFVCEECEELYERNFGDTNPFLRTFSPANSEPWITLLNKAHVISIDVRCVSIFCTGQAPTSTTATLYRPGRGFNMLALSQLLKTPDQGSGLKISMRFTPRSYRGAEEIVKFANALTKFVHGIGVGNVSIDARTLPQLPPGLLPKGLKSITNQLRRVYKSWTDEAPVHEAFLTECQQLLNEANVPIHQIACIAEQALHPMLNLVPFPDKRSQMIRANRLSELMMTKINGGRMLFLVVHGISEYTAKQLKEQNPSRHPQLPEDGEVFTTILSSRSWDQKLLRQGQANFREWGVDDLQYLIHQVAIQQACIRFRTTTFLASFQSIWPDELAFSKLDETRDTLPDRDISQYWIGRIRNQADIDFYRSPEGIRAEEEEMKRMFEEFRRKRTQTYISWVRDELDHLDRLNLRVGELQDDLHGDTVMARNHSSYEIPKFIKAVRELLDEVVPLIERGELNDQTLQTVDTSGLMMPERPQIPIVTDWESMLATFRDMNQAKMFWGSGW